MKPTRPRTEPPLGDTFAMLEQLASSVAGPGSPPYAIPDESDLAEVLPQRLPDPASGSLILDARGDILHLDRGAELVFRCTLGEMVGASGSLLLGELPAGLGVIEAVCRRRDGTSFPAELWRGAFRDMTTVAVRDKEAFDLFAAEQLQSELRFRHLVEQIPAVTFTAALQGGLDEIYVSPQIEALLGYSQHEWLSNPVLWFERLHPHDHATLNTEFARGCMTGGPFRAECRFIARSGEVVWVHGEARIIRDRADRPLFLQGVAFNVTDIRRLHEEQAARAAAEREHRREKLLSQVSLAQAQKFADGVPFQAIADLLVPAFADVCVIDALDDEDALQRVAVSHTPRADPRGMAAIRECTPEWDLAAPDEGVPGASLITDATAAGVHPECARILEQTGGSLMSLPLHGREQLLGMLVLVTDGQRRHFDDDDLRFGDALAHRIGTSIDNSRLYRLAQEAIRARDALVGDLERAVHLSEMFVGVLGHDLRNPLGSIVNAASLLSRRSDDEAVIRPVGRIFNSADRMRRMIDQILDFTRIRLGKGLPLERRNVDLGELSRTVADELLDERRSFELNLSVSGETTGQWDPDRLAQLVSNLIGNAIQHRRSSAPVRLRVDGTDAAHVVLEVWNDGVVLPELMPVLFEPLRSTAGSKRSGSSGLGLGLFISREIAVAHGGTIDVSSSEADGTFLTLRLPRIRLGRRTLLGRPRSAAE